MLLHGALSAVVACAGLANANSAEGAVAVDARRAALHEAVVRSLDVDDWSSPRASGYAPWLSTTRVAPHADFGTEPLSSPGAGEHAVEEIPPAPSSLALGLTALAGLGIYQAGRKIHFSRLPEWYHTGGPQQIGHATPLELDRVQLPVCVLDEPTPHVPCIVRFAFEAVVLIPLDHNPLATAPRAPPSISSIR